MARNSKPKIDAPSPTSLRTADYQHWANENFWTQSQIAFLLLGYEPMAEDAIPLEEVRLQYTNLKTLVEKNSGKKLKYYFPDMNGEPGFSPWIVIEWAESIPIRVPPALKSAVLENYPSQFRTGVLLEEIKRLKREIEALKLEVEQAQRKSLPPYMRTDHPYFSVELEAAVSAWIALYGEGTLVQKHAQKKQLAHWIREHYKSQKKAGTNMPLFGAEAVNRISMVANSNKTGGTPKIST